MDYHEDVDIEVSPFRNMDTLEKKDLINILKRIVEEAKQIDRIVFCTILGGGWVGNTYHSWKSNDINTKHHCLISGVFSDHPLYHLHSHHNGDELGLRPMGEINKIPVYSSLGDTPCLIESLDIKEDEYVINMGTGSQVISKIKENINTISFLPAGRSFLVFDRFFGSMGVDFFMELKRINSTEVYESTLEIDLNVFSKARNFIDGGMISRITENNFTLSNVMSSILRCFVLQYSEHLEDPSKNTIKLVGGIPYKLPIIEDLFRHYHPTKKIINLSNSIPHTHIGIIKLIKRHLL